MACARIPASVKHVEVAGEALTRSVVHSVGSAAALYNNYGPTEVTVDVTGQHICSAVPSQRLPSISLQHLAVPQKVQLPPGSLSQWPQHASPTFFIP